MRKIILLVLVSFIVPFFASPVRAITPVTWEQKGATVSSNSSEDFASPGFRTSLQNLRATGANIVNLNIVYTQSNISSTDIRPTSETPSDAALKDGIAYAKSIGLRVSLNLYVHPQTGQWRADLNPTDKSEWFKQYAEVVLRYARIGEELGVSQIVIGSEYITLASVNADPNNTSYWIALISKVRQVYSGKLTYGANWNGGELFGIEFWSYLDFIGISAYFELRPTTETISGLKTAWDTWRKSTIEPLHNKWNKPVVFTEIGYANYQKCYYYPYSPNGVIADDACQVLAYAATFDYWSSVPWMSGLLLWDWEVNPFAGGSGHIGYTPQNKLAESELAGWFGGASSITGPVFNARIENSLQDDTTGQHTFTVLLTNTGLTTASSNVDIEIYSSGTKVFQKVFAEENFTQGSSKAYEISWSPPKTGNYTIKLGVFNSDWTVLYRWFNGLVTVTLNAAPQAPIPPAVPPTQPPPQALPPPPSITPPPAPNPPPPVVTTPPQVSPPPAPVVPPPPETPPTIEQASGRVVANACVAQLGKSCTVFVAWNSSNTPDAIVVLDQAGTRRILGCGTTGSKSFSATSGSTYTVALYAVSSCDATQISGQPLSSSLVKIK